MGPIVVGTIGDDDGQSIGVMPCANQVIARRFGRAIRAAWIICRCFRKQTFGTQRTIHFIGRNVVKTAVARILAIAQPRIFSSVQQGRRADDVRFQKGHGVFNAPVHMAFSGQVHDGIKIVLNKELRDQGCVTNIPLDKRVALVGFDVSEVF